MNFDTIFESQNLELPLLTNENCPHYNNWASEEIAELLHNSLQHQGFSGEDILKVFLQNGYFSHPETLEDFSMATYIMVVFTKSDNPKYPLFQVHSETLNFFWSVLGRFDMALDSIQERLNNNELNLAEFPINNWE
jgi:hypothetical protein